MKTVILAGGYGTRLSEETTLRPKPMVEVGGRPLLWHILKHYARHGHTEFVIALGYKAEIIKEYFLNYHPLSGDITVDLASGEVTVRQRAADDWTVHLIDTGVATQTGGRLLRLREILGEERFMLTYGDGVANVDIGALIAFHAAQGRLSTVTAVRPPSRFGGIVFDGDGGDRVTGFTEKPQIGEGWINGGFMVMEPGVFDYLSGDDDVLEVQGLVRMAEDGQLSAFRHDAFWQCMDTLRDKQLLERLWQAGDPPWKTWA